MSPTQFRRELPTILTPLREYFQQEYQERLDRIILFGSHARGEATDISDIDVLIVLKDPVNASEELHRTSQFIAQLCLEHNLLISRLFMGRSRFETENSPLLRNIRSDGIVLWPQLIDAQAQRTRADYDPVPELSRRDAEILVEQAQAFLTVALQNLDSSTQVND